MAQTHLGAAERVALVRPGVWKLFYGLVAADVVVFGSAWLYFGVLR